MSKGLTEGHGHKAVTLTRFNRRYIGKLSEDGRRITGRWEFSEDGIN